MTGPRPWKQEFALNEKPNLDIEEGKKKAGESEEDLHRRHREAQGRELDKVTKSDAGAWPRHRNPSPEFRGRADARLPPGHFPRASRSGPILSAKSPRRFARSPGIHQPRLRQRRMKTEVTFNIFGAGRNGRADRELKGTIEVIRVLDANSSLARITSIYDAEGREVAWGDAGRGRPSREAENALKEGDLLYNTFWGSRVALAGNIHFAGQSSNSPAEQMRIMAGFVHFLSRQGITVDAILDLNVARSRALHHQSHPFRRSAATASKSGQAGRASSKKEAVKEGDENKEEAPKAEGFPDRLKMINDSAAKMRQEAVDKGLFVISTDNFLNVIGYRQPRSIYGDVAGFQPSAIMAGQPSANLNINSAPPAKGGRPVNNRPLKKKIPDPM